MSNAFFIPRGIAPNNVSNGDETGTYTVPSGYEAIVTVTMNVIAYANVTGNPAAITAPHGICGATSNSASIVFRMDEGEDLSFTSSPASYNSGGSILSNFSTTQSSTISAEIDLTTYHEIKCTLAIWAEGVSNTANAIISGEAVATWRAEEFLKYT